MRRALISFALLAALPATVVFAAEACSGGPLPVGVESGDGGRPDAPSRSSAASSSGSTPSLDSGGNGLHEAGSPIDAPRVEDGGVTNAVAMCVTATGWSWCNPQPAGVTLDSVWGANASDVWAVGAGGAAERWNGTTWSVVPTSTSVELFSVWGSSSGDVWAVGSNAYGVAAASAESVIIHWDGTAWSTTQKMAGMELWSVWGSGPSDVWAVGGNTPGNGVFLHWDGTAWATSPQNQVSVLEGVWGVDAATVWAVGNLTYGPDGATTGAMSSVPEILTLGDSNWSVVYNNGGTAASALPLSIWGATSDDVWVATGQTPIHWNGSQWNTPTFEGTTGPTAFGGTSTSDVWGTLGSEMVHWNGSQWATPSPVAGIASAGSEALTLSSVWASAPTNAWAVGVGGALAHYDGDAWQSVSPMPELRAAAAVTTDDAWAVGALGTALHWDGSAWSPTTTGTAATLVQVWAGDTDHVWAIDAVGHTLEWTAAAWSSPTTTSNLAVSAIGGTSATDVWFATAPSNQGDAGASGPPTNKGALVHFDGTNFTRAPVPSMMGLDGWVEAIWASAPDDVWAVGYQSTGASGAMSVGLVAHYDGAGWSLEDTPLDDGPTTATSYTSVWATPTGSEVWVAGSASGDETGALIHYTGGAWQGEALAGLSGTSAVWGSSANDVWLFARVDGTAEQLVLHYDGTTWVTSFLLPEVWSYGNALAGTGPNDLWAVGAGGMILHHS